MVSSVFSPFFPSLFYQFNCLVFYFIYLFENFRTYLSFLSSVQLLNLLKNFYFYHHSSAEIHRHLASQAILCPDPAVLAWSAPDPPLCLFVRRAQPEMHYSYVIIDLYLLHFILFLLLFPSYFGLYYTPFCSVSHISVTQKTNPSTQTYTHHTHAYYNNFFIFVVVAIFSPFFVLVCLSLVPWLVLCCVMFYLFAFMLATCIALFVGHIYGTVAFHVACICCTWTRL